VQGLDTAPNSSDKLIRWSCAKTERQRTWPQRPPSERSFPSFSQEPGRVVLALSRVWSSNQYGQVLQSRWLQNLHDFCVCCHNALLSSAFPWGHLRVTLLQMCLESLRWGGGCSAVITEKSQKIINSLGCRARGQRHHLRAQAAWRAMCLAVPDHSERAVFLPQHNVLCRGDKARVPP